MSDPKQGWKALYPFESHYMTIGGFKYHYLDEGPTEPDRRTSDPYLLAR